MSNEGRLNDKVMMSQCERKSSGGTEDQRWKRDKGMHGDKETRVHR